MTGVPTLGPDIRAWAEDIRRFLVRTKSQLSTLPPNTSAAEDGTMLWDRVNGYPVVSKSGEWRQVVLADGSAILGQDTNITAAAPDTAYKIALDAISLDGITLTGTPLTDITFVEGGMYMIAFSAQISSTSSSAVEFRFWPRINGSNATGSTMVASLHNNGATIVVARTTIFQMAANDVLNVMWAVDNTSGFLEAHAATAYAPASPSVTLAITRIKA